MTYLATLVSANSSSPTTPLDLAGAPATSSARCRQAPRRRRPSRPRPRRDLLFSLGDPLLHGADRGIHRCILVGIVLPRSAADRMAVVARMHMAAVHRWSKQRRVAHAGRRAACTAGRQAGGHLHDRHAQRVAPTYDNSGTAQA